MLKLVIFEGVDKSGKTTLFRAYRSATNYQPLAWDRGPGSNIVYDALYFRADKSKEIYKAEKVLEENFLVYLIYCYLDDLDLLKKRLGTYADSILVDIIKAQAIYEKYLEKTPFRRILRVNTKVPVEEALQSILEFTGESGDWGVE